MSLPSIGIIGGGTVGTALARYYQRQGIQIKIYDKFLSLDPLSDTLKQDYIFIAVPTNFDGISIDLSAMDEAMQCASQSLAYAIIIKSTVIPGTTEKYQEQYPKLKILFNPEFLTEANAEQDFANPERQILGYTLQSQSITEEVVQLLPKAPFVKSIPAKEAEMVKYFGNAFLAIKVVFANQIYDLCQALGIDYEIVAECTGHDSRIGASHLKIWHDDLRGYGGKCLPKDVKSLLVFAKSLGVDLSLLRECDTANESFVHGKEANTEIPIVDIKRR